jgi:hypothetical protein
MMRLSLTQSGGVLLLLLLLFPQLPDLLDLKEAFV